MDFFRGLIAPWSYAHPLQLLDHGIYVLTDRENNKHLLCGDLRHFPAHHPIEDTRAARVTLKTECDCDHLFLEKYKGMAKYGSWTATSGDRFVYLACYEFGARPNFVSIQRRESDSTFLLCTGSMKPGKGGVLVIDDAHNEITIFASLDTAFLLQYLSISVLDDLMTRLHQHKDLQEILRYDGLYFLPSTAGLNVETLEELNDICRRLSLLTTSIPSDDFDKIDARPLVQIHNESNRGFGDLKHIVVFVIVVLLVDLLTSVCCHA